MSALLPAAAVITGLVLPLASTPENSPSRLLHDAATAEWRTLANSRLGCNSPDVFTEAAKQAASEKYLMSKLKSGDCRLLPAGKVQVEKATPADRQPAQLCVKPEDIDKCWWVPTDSMR